MNSLSSLQPEQAWQVALTQLQMDMPKATFDTWVRDTRFVAFEDGMFTVSIASLYACEWLTNRLTNTAVRLLTGILNQSVAVQFVVAEEFYEELQSEEDHAQQEASNPDGNAHPAILNLQAEYQSVYDEIIQPDQVVVLPGYFARYIPLLGLELAWLYIGFRQAAYEAGAVKRPGKKFGAPAKKIARYAGMSLRTFWRWVTRPNTWQRLGRLVKPVDEAPRWSRGVDGRPHRATRCYRVAMGLPLTPFDEMSLRQWLYRGLAEGNNPLAVLGIALETPVAALIPWPEKAISPDDLACEPHSVQQVLQEVCGPIREADVETFRERSDKLAQHLMPQKDLIFLTHYFVEHWLPSLGSGPGWFVTLMRDRGYINQRTGEIRDEVKLSQGYAEVARWLGLKRVKTVWEWLRSTDVATFVRETGKDAGAWESAPRRFQVCLGEPMTETDRLLADQSLSSRMPGASDTHSQPGSQTPNGAGDTYSNEPLEQPVGGIVTHSGALDTHSGATDTHRVGASDTHIGASDTHKIGASDTSHWREWHSLNTLTLGFKHLENTSTTAPASNGTEPAQTGADGQPGVVGSDWDLTELLFRNHVNPKRQEWLLKNGLTAAAWVSWLLYAASPGGDGIRDPIGHAISRLVQRPNKGAGNVYDRLAALPLSELAQWLHQELNGQRSANPDWRKVMIGAQLSRLRALAEQLGVPAPDTPYC